jgi:hypothetical protein
MNPAERDTSTEKTHRSSWLSAAGVAATGVAGVALLLFRGCWHRRMSWPVTVQGYAYQVCLGCGVKRLFDEKSFRSYGPFKWDLDELIAWERARVRKANPGPPPQEHRSAS